MAIEGATTDAAGFVGRAATGPVDEARLVTSAGEFDELYGGLEAGDEPPYLALAAHAFFLNGGRRLWVARVADGGAGVAGVAGVAGALEALAAVDEIALVAAPGPGDPAIAEALIAHAEGSRRRFALVDAPAGSSVDDVRLFREGLDSGFAALYHPWIEPSDAFLGSSGRVVLPPSGFVAGIYARAGFKPPVGVAVVGADAVESEVDHQAQGVLTGDGVNVLRVTEGDGVRLWGARTLSSDPEWKYVNIRRYVIFLERSLDEGLRWAVFEPNGEELWTKVRQTVGEFLEAQWREGNLYAGRSQDAYFVRCDRTTMTQDDIDHGRLVVLVGVAPVRPAEFVVLRIGQWTADRS